ncbi:MAG: alpha/beta hydrolase-fold protein [Gammaproteobacteria bacterium]
MCTLRNSILVRYLIAMTLLSLLLSGCYMRKPAGPIPVKEIPAPQQATSHPLVIVLPGRGDDLKDLQSVDIAQAIHKAWPQADVLLAGATISYYAYGSLTKRLHDEIIVPAQQRGYREIWLTGASMGGMGALLYERQYPHDVTGLVLFAPYMGDKSLVEKITADGGLRNWNPGAAPASVNGENYQTEIWRVVKTWALHPETAQNVWLAAGSRDRLLPASQLVAAALPSGHFIELPGGHDWKLWDAAATQIFARISAQTAQDCAHNVAGC